MTPDEFPAELVERVAGVLANVLEDLSPDNEWGPCHVSNKEDETTFREEHLGYAIAVLRESKHAELVKEIARLKDILKAAGGASDRPSGRKSGHTGLAADYEAKAREITLHFFPPHFIDEAGSVPFKLKDAIATAIAQSAADLRTKHAELVTALEAVEPAHNSEGNLTLETVGMSVAVWTEKRDAALGGSDPGCEWLVPGTFSDDD